MNKETSSSQQSLHLKNKRFTLKFKHSICSFVCDKYIGYFFFFLIHRLLFSCQKFKLLLPLISQIWLAELWLAEQLCSNYFHQQRALQITLVGRAFSHEDWEQSAIFINYQRHRYCFQGNRIVFQLFMLNQCYDGLNKVRNYFELHFKRSGVFPAHIFTVPRGWQAGMNHGINK